MNYSADFLTRLEALQSEMAERGHPMMITDAGRTARMQYKLFRIGRNARGKKIGKTVTNADGYNILSNHQADPKTGLFRAVDMTFLVDGPDLDDLVDDPSWDEAHPWDLFGEQVRKVGLRWGGDWKVKRRGKWYATPDRPHVEMPR